MKFDHIIFILFTLLSNSYINGQKLPNTFLNSNLSTKSEQPLMRLFCNGDDVNISLRPDLSSEIVQKCYQKQTVASIVRSIMDQCNRIDVIESEYSFSTENLHTKQSSSKSDDLNKIEKAVTIVVSQIHKKITDKSKTLNDFYQTDRAKILNITEKNVTNDTRQATYCFYKNRNSPDTETRLLCEDGLECLSSSIHEPSDVLQRRYRGQLQDIYHIIQSKKYVTRSLPNIEIPENYYQEVNELIDEYSPPDEPIYETNDDDPQTNREQERLQALQSTEPLSLYNDRISPEVTGFMNAHGIDIVWCTGYEQNPIQKQITKEIINACDKLLQIKNNHKEKDLLRAIAAVSEGSLIHSYNHLVKKACEWSDANWTLIEITIGTITGSLEGISTALISKLIPPLAILNIAYMAGNIAWWIANESAEVDALFFETDYDPPAAKERLEKWEQQSHKRKDEWNEWIRNKPYREIAHNCASTTTSIICFKKPPRTFIKVERALQPIVNKIAIPVRKQWVSCCSQLTKYANNIRKVTKEKLLPLKEQMRRCKQIARRLFPVEGESLILKPEPFIITPTDTEIKLFSKQDININSKGFSPHNPPPFEYFDTSTQLIPGIEQIDWKYGMKNMVKYTNNFSKLDHLKPHEILYLNYNHWFYYESQPLLKQLRDANLHFIHENIRYNLKNWDLHHVFIGDYDPIKNQFSGMHKKWLHKLYKFENRIINNRLMPHVIYPNINPKYSDHFPTEWTIKKCIAKLIHGIQNQNYQVIDMLKNNTSKKYTLLISTECKHNIIMSYHSKKEFTKTFWYKDQL